MDNFADNVQALRKLHKLSQSKLAETVGVTRTAVTNWEKGGNYPTVPVLMKLAEALGATTDDLLYSENILEGLGVRLDLSRKSRHLTSENVTQSRKIDENGSIEGENVKERFVQVPGSAVAGIALDIPTLKGAETSFSIPGLRGPGIIVEVQGNSMEPVLYDGDFIVCTRKMSQWDELQPDLMALVITSQSTASVKYVRLQVEGVQCISANNLEYPPYLVTFEDLTEIWWVDARISRHLAPPKENMEMVERVLKIEEYLSKSAPGWQGESAETSKRK